MASPQDGVDANQTPRERTGRSRRGGRNRNKNRDRDPNRELARDVSAATPAFVPNEV